MILVNGNNINRSIRKTSNFLDGKVNNQPHSISNRPRPKFQYSKSPYKAL